MKNSRAQKAVMLAIGLMLVISTFVAGMNMVSAQYSESVSDGEDDVSYYKWTDSGYRWKENVVRENIDITRVGIEESGGNISLELEVKGTILSQEQSEFDVWYSISLEDGNEDSYDISYNFGTLSISWPEGQELGFTEASGFGTSTFEVSFSLDKVGNPDSLKITSAETYEYLEEQGSGEHYEDSAGPESDDPGDSDGGGGTDGALDELLARGMMCLAVAIIVPIIILVIIIVVVIKLLSSEDEESQQPPQQGPPPQQQQRPPGQQQPQQQQPQQEPRDEKPDQ